MIGAIGVTYGDGSERRARDRQSTRKGHPRRDRSPADALWGAQSQRGIDNYPISGLRPFPAFVRALVSIKKAEAIATPRQAVWTRAAASDRESM